MEEGLKKKSHTEQNKRLCPFACAGACTGEICSSPLPPSWPMLKYSHCLSPKQRSFQVPPSLYLHNTEVAQTNLIQIFQNNHLCTESAWKLLLDWVAVSKSCEWKHQMLTYIMFCFPDCTKILKGTHKKDPPSYPTNAWHVYPEYSLFIVG